MDVSLAPPRAPSKNISLRKRLAAEIRASDIVEAWWENQFEPERLSRFDVAGAREKTREEAVQFYLEPLQQLLAAFVETGEERYRAVYLDERLRFAPHLAAPTVRAEFFREVLSADEAALAATMGPADGDALLEILQDLHAPLRAGPTGRPLRVLALGDCLMTELRASLPSYCRRAGLEVDLRILYFSALSGRHLSVEQAAEFLKGFPADLVVLSLFSYQGSPLYTSLLREADRLGTKTGSSAVAGLVHLLGDFLGRLREHTDAPFLVHNASGLPLTRLRKHFPLLPALSRGRRQVVRELNKAVLNLVEHSPYTILVDEAAVAQHHGHRECTQPLIPRRVVRKAYFHTSRFGNFLADTYLDIFESYRALHRVKVLLVDFDNTLWDGVMAEGPVRQRSEFQQLLRRLKEAGFLLVAVSKNDPANIRWQEMTLQPDDFVLQKISWQPKAQSISETAAQLSLGLNSFLLIDDNPAEREMVRTQLPQVGTLDPNEHRTRSWLERLLRFPNARQTEEARARTELYRQQAERQAAMKHIPDYAAMMASLGLKASFARAGRGDLERLCELVQRTNQFNTTGRRYTKPELETLLLDRDHGVYVTNLADKFGSMGLVGAVIVERRGPDRVLDSFVMSCRAMGFELERLMLRLTLDAETVGASQFIGRFIATDRNTPAQALFSDQGFSRLTPTEWRLDADAPRPEVPEWFAVEKKL